MNQALEEMDVLVAGAGAAGLCAALALARHGRRVTLVGRTDARLAGRTVALFEGSLRLLARFGIEEPPACRIAGIRIVDDTGALLLQFRDLLGIFEAGFQPTFAVQRMPDKIGRDAARNRVEHERDGDGAKAGADDHSARMERFA